MASIRVPTPLIWLSAAGIALGSLYHIYINTGIPLTTEGILRLAGYVPKFTKEDAAESYLRSVCPANKAERELLQALVFSSMDGLPSQELLELANKYYKANTASIEMLTSNDKKWPDEVKSPMHDLIQISLLENDLLYRYQNHRGSASQLTNGDLATKMREVDNKLNPRPSVLIRMRLGIVNVDC
jgi:hypothetical protein